MGQCTNDASVTCTAHSQCAHPCVEDNDIVEKVLRLDTLTPTSPDFADDGGTVLLTGDEADPSTVAESFNDVTSFKQAWPSSGAPLVLLASEDFGDTQDGRATYRSLRVGFHDLSPGLITSIRDGVPATLELVDDQ